MTRPIILTAAWLRQHNACPAQVAEFRRLFGPEVLVCPETLDMAVTAGLSVTWLGGEVLTAAAWRAYIRVADAAWAAYDRVAAPAWTEYNRVTAATMASLLADPANWQPEVLAELRRDV